MGILDILGINKPKFTMNELWDVMAVLKQEIKETKKKAKEKGQEWRIDILKEKMFKKLVELQEEGIIVDFDEKDGGGELRKGKKRWMKFDLDKMYNEYFVPTIEGIEKEIKRRQKEAEREHEK